MFPVRMANVIVDGIVDEDARGSSICALRIEVLSSRLASVQGYSDTDGGVAMLGIEGGGARHEALLKAGEDEATTDNGENVRYHVENHLESIISHLLLRSICK